MGYGTSTGTTLMLLNGEPLILKHPLIFSAT